MLQPGKEVVYILGFTPHRPQKTKNESGSFSLGENRCLSTKRIYTQTGATATTKTNETNQPQKNIRFSIYANYRPNLSLNNHVFVFTNCLFSKTNPKNRKSGVPNLSLTML
jgi:hypothetical protein